MSVDRSCAICGKESHWDRFTLPPTRRGGLVLRFCGQDCLDEWESAETECKDREPERRGVGRPRIKLTVGMVESAERLFKAGHSNRTVGQAVGASRRTVYRWIEEGGKAHQAGDESEDTEMVRLFWHAYIEGRVGVKKKIIKNIIDASEKDWRAGVWYLSVTEPEDYNEKVVTARALHELGVATQDTQDPPVDPRDIRPQLDAPPPIVKPD